MCPFSIYPFTIFTTIQDKMTIAWCKLESLASEEKKLLSRMTQNREQRKQLREVSNILKRQLKKVRDARTATTLNAFAEMAQTPAKFNVPDCDKPPHSSTPTVQRTCHNTIATT